MRAPVRRCSRPSSSMIAGPGRGLVAKHAAAGQARNSAIVGWESVGNTGNGRLEDEAHHLPVAGDRVLSRARPRPSCPWLLPAPPAASDPPIATRRPSPSAAQRRQPQRHLRARSPSVLLPSSPYRRRVRQLADTDAVEHDHDGSVERGLSEVGDLHAARSSRRRLRQHATVAGDSPGPSNHL